MKHLVQQLSDQARLSVPQGLSADKWIEVYNEKLVELVVRECDMVLSKDDGATHHSELLFTHFGVEE